RCQWDPELARLARLWETGKTSCCSPFCWTTQMRGFGASSVSHQHGKGTKCGLFQGIFLGKGLWGKVGHRHVVRHHAVWGKIPGKMPLGKSATVVQSDYLFGA